MAPSRTAAHATPKRKLTTKLKGPFCSLIFSVQNDLNDLLLVLMHLQDKHK